MSDDQEFGPDPNAVRRHAKKMFNNADYLKMYRRIGFYKPSPKQAEWHNLFAIEKACRAGNQTGKTTAGAAQMAMDAINFYPHWYEGPRHVIPKIERAFEFLGWAASTFAQPTRDGVQTRLLGDIRAEGGLGTGMIPLDNIVGRPTMARGISDFVDTISLRRETGGRAIIRLKTYDQKTRGFQGEPVDRIWLDEDVSRDDESIYGEVLARLTSTDGRVYLTLTPRLGLSPIRKRFKQRLGGDCAEVLMTLHDAAISAGGHLSDEKIAQIIARYAENERETRVSGADMQGEGAVFAMPVEAIKCEPIELSKFPAWCRFIWGLDLSHGGQSASAHPFAAVLLCHDPQTDIVIVVHAIRLFRALPETHVKAIKSHPYWDAPVAYPADANRADFATGEQFRNTYRRLGLNMRPTHASFPGKEGNSLEAGISVIDQRSSGGLLKVFWNLTEVFDEWIGYHRVEGQVHKVDDDLLSAIRCGLMDLRYAKAASVHQGRGPEGSFDHSGRDQNRFAIGTPGNQPFDIFTGGSAGSDFDPFSGR